MKGLKLRMGTDLIDSPLTLTLGKKVFVPVSNSQGAAAVCVCAPTHTQAHKIRGTLNNLK